MYGHAGKILLIDLTIRRCTIIQTSAYEGWVGGHGLGSALFWDLVKDKTIDGFDPTNLITIMTSPLTGTLATGASARVEVQGIGVQSSPIGWFTRSNVGGRFGTMLKYAGWDGVAVMGQADMPIWIDIRNDAVSIRTATHLWGLDTWETQRQIWKEVIGTSVPGDWFDFDSPGIGRRTTQLPAVLTIGPAGENKCRVASLIHDAGNSSGQGGFGAVWGAKNLKAISVIGTGSVTIADPKALMEARLWAKKNYETHLGKLRDIKDPTPIKFHFGFGAQRVPMVMWRRPKEHRPQACTGCHSGCRTRTGTGQGNESSCIDTEFYSHFDLSSNSGPAIKALIKSLENINQKGTAKAVGLVLGRQTDAAYRTADLMQKLGINAGELWYGLPYLRDLYKMGVLGPGKEIECDLPFDEFGQYEFAEKLLHKMAYREGSAAEIADGFYRAARDWGRLEEDLGSGILRFPWWGLPDHYDARAQIEWGYGSIMGDRDINEHDFNMLFWMASPAIWRGRKPLVSAEEVARIYAEKMEPYQNDSLLLDYSTENIYSEHMAKLVAWHRHYTRFWKQSVLFCDIRYADIFNPNRPDHRGMTGEAEPRFFRAVTGRDLSFADGNEIGRRIWNLDNAIWTIQGRHRDMVYFADYIYTQPFAWQFSGSLSMYYLPGRKNGRWKYIPMEGRTLDKVKFDEWKTHFYELEGWSTATGWPMRSTLEQLDMKPVADALEYNGRIGREIA